MGQTQTFNRVVLDVGGSVDDYARGADVYVSAAHGSLRLSGEEGVRSRLTQIRSAVYPLAV